VASLPAHLNELPGHPAKHGRTDFILDGPGPFSSYDSSCTEE
jgi:hypothetical protein